jgi:transposase
MAGWGPCFPPPPRRRPIRTIRRSGGSTTPDDALWALLAPILKSDKPRKQPGRPRRADRAIFDGLIWLARTGGHWSQLPREFGPKSTVHERFTEWVKTGALERAWAVLLHAYDGELGLDWSWQAADGCIVTAPVGKKGALARSRRRGRIPPDCPPTGPNRAPNGTG